MQGLLQSVLLWEHQGVARPPLDSPVSFSCCVHPSSCAINMLLQAARMLHYLGDHILMLTSMNLRDYLRLKVEIQGTSGEGSKAVKAFRSPSQGFCAYLLIKIC